MSVTDVTARIQQIQSQLAMLAPAASTTSTAGTDFAAALDGATETTGTTAAGTTGDILPSGKAVVTEARKYLGIPYVWGGTDPDKGLDCSGLVQLVYKNLGFDLPRVSGDQARAGTEVPGGLAAAQPGDVLAFGSPVHHVGIYLGDNQMIAAPHTGDHVKIQKVYDKPTQIRRVLGDADQVAMQNMASIRPAALNGSGGLAGVPYADLFVKAGTKYGISPKLLAAVAKVESGYNPHAVSGVGARGLMQLMPSTAKGLGVADAFDPEQAILGGAKLLAHNLREFKSVPLALAAYNAGGGAVKKYGGIPPFAETQAYVPKVQKALAALGG